MTTKQVRPMRTVLSRDVQAEIKRLRRENNRCGAHVEPQPDGTEAIVVIDGEQTKLRCRVTKSLIANWGKSVPDSLWQAVPGDREKTPSALSKSQAEDVLVLLQRQGLPKRWVVPFDSLKPNDSGGYEVYLERRGRRETMRVVALVVE